MTIPAYPSTFDMTLDQNLMIKQGNNLVVDMNYYDRY